MREHLAEHKYLYFSLLMSVMFVLGLLCYFYITAINTGLPGRRGGPQDAFRHIYASAFVTKYFSSNAVEVVTWLTERDAESEHDRMDRHNNRLGIMIGLSEKQIYQKTLDLVSKAKVDPAEMDQAYVLEKSKWENRNVFPSIMKN